MKKKIEEKKMLKLAGLENLAETELGRIKTKSQQENYIQQIMAPELKNFLDKIPALREKVYYNHIK